jgi:AraC-like DNA-binding protein
MTQFSDFASWTPSIRFTTEKLPKTKQFDEWTAFISPVAEVGASNTEQDGLAAEAAIWDMGSLAFFRFLTPSLPHRRTPRLIRKEPVDHWMLSFPKSRTLPTPAALPIGRKAAGRLTLHSLGRPFEIRMDDGWTIGVMIPRHLLGALSSELDGGPQVIAGNGRGAMLIDYLLTVEHRLPSMTRDERPQLALATQAMLKACLATNGEHRTEARAPLSATLFERARLAVQRDLRSPALGAAELCRLAGISRSRLYQLFEHHGGVARYIQRQRLLVAHAELSDPDDARSTREVAEALGFSDASSFARSFREEFDLSPGEARAAARAGMPQIVAPSWSFHGEATELRELLWRLSA